MQRERGSFHEPIDLNQGSIPSSTPMDHSSSWENMVSPDENRLSNYMLGPSDPNGGCTNATSDCHNLSGWDSGESSSSMNNLHNVTESKTSLGWSNFFDPPQPSVGASSSRSPSMQNYSFAPATTLDLNSDDGYARESHGFHKSGRSEIDQNPTFHASSSNLGAFTGSSSASADNNETPVPSLSAWGSHCKRKALEDTSGQFYSPAGTSSSDWRQPSFPGDYHSRGNLNISSVSNYQGQPPGFLPSSSGGLATSRLNNEGHEPTLLNNSGITSLRNLGAYSSESRMPVTITMNPNGSLSQTRSAYGNELSRGGTNPYPPWNRPSGSHGLGLPGSEPRAREEVSVRTYRRNNNSNLEYPLNVSAQQDQVDWSFVPNSPSSRNHSTGLRAGPSSGGSRASSSAYTPPRLSPPAQNHQRWPETTWVPFHCGENETPIRRGHFFPHLNSQTDEAGPSSRPQNQLDQRSPAFLMDAAGDDVSGWRSLAAVESRHRLIRQVLSAMRRGVHLQAEDYMLVDPFISGFAELHDRHRDMRLDVDNMSYEELLALEERIGNVSTGLSEEKITDAMKQRKFESVDVLPNLEPCCVCQEDYVTGNDIGILDCGHEFHTDCIKQWLTVKNLCPICKTTALGI